MDICCCWQECITYSGSWLEIPHTSGNHSTYRKKKKQLIPYCVSPMLLDNILQRKLSNQAYWVAWLKKDAFMFQANRAFPMQLYSKLSLYQNSERCQLENNALLHNSFFSCCYLVSVFMEIFTDFTHWYISFLIYLEPKTGVQNVEKSLRLSPDFLSYPAPNSPYVFSQVPSLHPSSIDANFLKIWFYWSLVDWQCCVNFCCTAKWFSYIYILSHILFHYGLSQDIELNI